jgi:hypothetical protein
MLFVHTTRNFNISVSVTNYINKHKKSTGFREMPVVFKNRRPTAKNRTFISPNGRQVHVGFTRYPRVRLSRKC